MSVTIPTPCQQRWGDMRPAEGGRFCAQCQKNVVDFSDMTDRQILDVLNRQTGNLCGRFRPEQINRPLVVPAETGPRTPWLRLLTVSLFGWQTVQAQVTTTSADARPVSTANPEVMSINAQPAPTKPPGPQAATPVDSSRVITGRVTEENGSPLPSVTVSIRGTNRGVVTNTQGRFALPLPTHEFSTITVQFGYVGYLTKEYELKANASRTLNVALAEDTDGLLGEVVTGGVGVVVVRQPSRWQRLLRRLNLKR